MEIGSCGGADVISRFYYPPNVVDFVGGVVPKLRLRGHEDYCVTYLGGNGKPTKGSPVVLVKRGVWSEWSLKSTGLPPKCGHLWQNYQL